MPKGMPSRNCAFFGKSVAQVRSFPELVPISDSADPESCFFQNSIAGRHSQTYIADRSGRDSARIVFASRAGSSISKTDSNFVSLSTSRTGFVGFDSLR
jgi:hypothetical protein